MVSRQEARQQLRELEGRRKTIEDEMEALTQTLPAGAGVRGSLVDSEGFPRADMDVHQTLIHRNRMACAPPAPSLPPPHALHQPHPLPLGPSAGLQTDHKQLMMQIEELLPVAMSKPPPGGEGPPPADGGAAAAPALAVPLPAAATTDAPEEYTPPFALIDEVSAGGPAASAGLCVGDELVSFGGLRAVELRRNGRLDLQPLAGLVRESEDRALAVVVQREGQYQRLELTPTKWDGQGLLGCHLQPM